VDDGGHGAVVGGKPGGEGEEALGRDPGVGLQVDAVDGEEVGVDVVPVVGQPEEAG
jgi:hypothetical protein